MVGMAGHEKPHQLAPVAPLCGKKLLGEDLEERLPENRRNRKGSLGPIETKSGALTTGDRKGGDPSLSQRFLAGQLRLHPRHDWNSSLIFATQSARIA
jgi:hypothetical protein